MKIAERKPVVAEFTLTVSTDELRVITEALNNSDSLESGDATDYGVWDELNDFMDEHEIKKLSQ